MIEQLSRYTADKLVMGMDGLDLTFGLTSKTHVEVYIMHKMIEQSKEKILVVDDSKIGRSSFVRVTDITAFDKLVTNYSPANEEILRAIEKKGVEVIIA
ncbi:Glucitol operon repressor [bioreactor metagenome]|uniref:Glucitol operon repressor n=1 Tax=bioreactor metagenome TaxID=1076179 RepID=A0A645JXL0_9ZZZZ